eukprot:CAMPEP_0176171202 /NCGR_PEP_ID=MMETSP0120_2-20121206/87641_1 /TAXON_ID=160619 /ORGANISM="Kryptoperidinium foliaceum, Strain CCMP 1326" /LENGTH=106 /DNA_ID=CAMNT_0017509015 /DNA_START=167 /DNA_END=487 /DNA_ORIENTATION=-
MAQKQQEEHLHYDRPYVMTSPTGGAKAMLTLSTEFESLFLHLWSQQRVVGVEDDAQRNAHAQRVYQKALENDESVDQCLLAVLEEHFPSIYRHHLESEEARLSAKE